MPDASSAGCWVEDARLRPGWLLFEGEDAPPVVLHIDNRPALCIGLIECLVELPNGRSAIIGPFPSCVVVVDEHREARAVSRGRPLQHLQVSVGVAE